MAVYPGLSDRSDYLREILNLARDAYRLTMHGRGDLDVAAETLSEIERLAKTALSLEE